MTAKGGSAFLVRRGLSGSAEANFDADFMPHPEVILESFSYVVDVINVTWGNSVLIHSSLRARSFF